MIYHSEKNRRKLRSLVGGGGCALQSLSRRTQNSFTRVLEQCLKNNIDFFQRSNFISIHTLPYKLLALLHLVTLCIVARYFPIFLLFVRSFWIWPNFVTKILEQCLRNNMKFFQRTNFISIHTLPYKLLALVLSITLCIVVRYFHILFIFASSVSCINGQRRYPSQTRR